jgi:pre-mRNA-processing factor SLU7
MSNNYRQHDRFQSKAIEEARKAGTVEPEKDEDGNDINPHIPQYIAKAPWYISKGVPSLQHQRREDRDDQPREDQWYKKGARVGEAATKYRKGACENCGAISHKTKDCVERPRRKGAKLTGKDIEADEVITEVNLNYESKRDRWNGYDPSMYKDYYDKFQVLEEARRKFKTNQLNTKAQEQKSGEQTEQEEKMVSDDEDDEENVLEEDDEREAEGKAEVFTGTNPKNKSSVKNLRIREDTAKYLYNLNDESAHYDPKTRSMRENPLPEYENTELVFAGDNAIRKTGQWRNFIEVQRYAWEANEHGQEVHMVGVPSQAEYAFKNFQEKKNKLKEDKRKEILDTYGGEEYLKAPQEVEQLAETEAYVQYSRDGKVLAGRAKAVKKSKYEEDVHVNGHTSVWGSLYKDGKWGYACCDQVGDRNVRCSVNDPLLERAIVLPPPAATVSAEAITALEPVIIQQPAKETRPEYSDSSSDYSTSSSDEDEREKKRKEKKLKKKKEKKHKKRKERDEVDPRLAAKRRRYENNIADRDMTEEEYQEFKKHKKHSEDPMANYVDE